MRDRESRRRARREAFLARAHGPDFGHGHGYFHGRAMRRMRGVALQRRIFKWFGLTILLTAGASALVGHVVGHTGRLPFVAVLVASFVLWIASWAVARRLGRPLAELARVTSDIGSGNLKSRARLGWHETGEVGALAESINDMAARIEKQLGDQRELVAAVSHEIRAPLSRLRVLVEILSGKGVDPGLTAKLEREILEIDSLVGDLLASSRLEFSLVSPRPLDAQEVATEALDRAGLPADRLALRTQNLAFSGDPTLVSRALANLLDNAARHAGGATALVVRDDGPDRIVFEVTDSGPGVPPELLPRVFEAFQRGQEGRRGSTSLGLGLSLVRRIAEAHGGAALAENLPEGGARFSFVASRRAPIGPP
ncbi:MAG TPA: HAMP domain-containing sensor histidine kinase [Polyangiaceae bacterium]|nr:HAMP domain-containing sensor histidine kinase [Polyangiaceae bacterium]